MFQKVSLYFSVKPLWGSIMVRVSLYLRIECHLGTRSWTVTVVSVRETTHPLNISSHQNSTLSRFEFASWGLFYLFFKASDWEEKTTNDLLLLSVQVSFWWGKTEEQILTNTSPMLLWHFQMPVLHMPSLHIYIYMQAMHSLTHLKQKVCLCTMLSLKEI